jgi:hypothetical protein
VEDQISQFSVHLPTARVTLVLDLIVGPQMPLAVPLTTPERIIAARICRLDASQIVSTALSRNPPRLHLVIFARWSRCRRNIVSSIARTTGMAILHMIRSRHSRRTRSGRVNVSLRRVAIARHRVVVRPLVRRIEVSKRVQRTIHVVIVIAAVSRGVRGVIAGIAIVVIGTTTAVVGRILGLVVGTGCLYPGIVATCCDANAHAHAHAHAHTAIGDDTGRRRAVWCLAGIGEDAALAIARGVDVLMARLRVGLHYDGNGLTSAMSCGVE